MRREKLVKLLALAALIALVAVRAEDDDDDDDEEEEGEDKSIDESAVHVLTPKNFDATVKNGSVLVEFYAPWCGHCKQLKPHYARAALQLKKEFPSITLAKVDANKYKSLGKKHDVQGFPTLKWFHDGKVSDFNGGRTDEAIVNWIKKRLGPATQMLSTSADHDAFTSSADVVVVGFFEDPKEDNPEWQSFQETAREFESVPFGTASTRKAHDHAGHTEGDIVMYKKHDGGSKKVFEGVRSVKALKDWVNIHQLGHVTEFSPDHSSKIFASPIRRQVLFFGDKSAAGYDAMRKHFTAAAKQYYGKVVAVAVMPEHKSVMEYFGVTAEMLPCVFAVRLPDESGESKTVRYRGPAGADLKAAAAVSDFIRMMLSGKVAPHRKSEPAPTDPVDEHGVTTLVGSNFEAIALDPAKDVLVEFYAPWCGHCKQLAPVYNELGSAFKNISSVVIAKMDATANDPPEGTEIQGFPTIKFFQAGVGGKGDKTVLEFNGERTLDGFKEFLEENVGISFKKKAGKGKKNQGQDSNKTEL